LEKKKKKKKGRKLHWGNYWHSLRIGDSERCWHLRIGLEMEVLLLRECQTDKTVCAVLSSVHIFS
jgi:hypothetical protein